LLAFLKAFLKHAFDFWGLSALDGITNIEVKISCKIFWIFIKSAKTLKIKKFLKLAFNIWGLSTFDGITNNEVKKSCKLFLFLSNAQRHVKLAFCLLGFALLIYL